MQPILAAIDMTAGQRDQGTFAHFGENWFVVSLLMLDLAPQSQPPANPVRFKGWPVTAFSHGQSTASLVHPAIGF